MYGKIEKINKHDGTVITYTYDASGNRIGKVITGAASGNGETWYVHDASGNVMSVYTVNDNTVNSGALTLSEQDLYGSSRLGLYKPNLNLATYTAPSLISMNGLGSVGYNNTFTRGKKFFELNNHLGNVLVTVSDKKSGVDGNNDLTIDYYLPDIVSANSYYPGGMLEPGRTFTANNSSYRYGFNGQEKDTTINPSHYTAEFWEYDARSVRRWNLDPKPTIGISPYSAFNGNPIFYSDPLGDTTGPRHTPQTGDCENCKAEALKDGDYFSDVQDQQFTLKLGNVPQASFDKFKTQMASDPGKIVDNKLAKYALIDRDGSYGVTEGDQFDIDIRGPDNGSVVVSNVTNRSNFLSVTVKTLEGHPDAGQNTFMASYDPNTQTMTWETHNISRSNDFMTQGVGSGIVGARSLQQKQWGNVMRQVYQYVGKPVIQVAKSVVKEYDYNDYTNKVGNLESTTTKDLKKVITEK